MMKCYVLQGVSGSGKSTYAKKLVAELMRGNRPEYVAESGAIILSTDDFFLDKGGEYRFDGSKLGIAHAGNMRKFIDACRNEFEVVICDNTNTSIAELAPYVAVADAFGYEVEIHFVKCDPAVAAARNTHGVPVHAVEAMARRIENSARDIPPWWTRKTIG